MCRITTHESLAYKLRTTQFSLVTTSPAQISADQNDYNPGGSGILRLNTSASKNITGIVAGQDGQIIEIWNVGSNDVVLKHQNASSSRGESDYLLWCERCHG